jgi:hypothetical protein
VTERDLRKISELSYNQDKLVEFLNSLKAKETWNYSLTNEGDFQTHSSDIRIPACERGTWLVMASENESFSYSKNGVAYMTFNCSNIAFTQRQVSGIYEFTVVDRNSGKPLKGVRSEFFVYKYNALLRRYENRKIGEGGL